MRASPVQDKRHRVAFPLALFSGRLLDENMSKDKPDVDKAYALKTPEDSKRLYAGWADTYDQSFAVDQDYRLPKLTAQAFRDVGGSGPVLDVGSGTGLCGAELAKLAIGPIDAIDISPEMLDVATGKPIYRSAFQADLTQSLPVGPDTYTGIVSSGTFTHGHVGPDCLDELLRIARPKARFALSINAAHFESAGFSGTLSDLVRSGRIQGLTLPKTRIYGENSTGEHKDDMAFIALFTKS